MLTRTEQCGAVCSAELVEVKRDSLTLTLDSAGGRAGGVVAASLTASQDRVSVCSPQQLARKLSASSGCVSCVLLDVRPFFAFNQQHIHSASNVNCADRFNRRRLSLGRASLADLTCGQTAREALRRRGLKRQFIVYDDHSSWPSSSCASTPSDCSQPLQLVVNALLSDNRRPLVLQGGIQQFSRCFPHLCDSHLLLQSPASPQTTTDGDVTTGGVCDAAAQLKERTDAIENARATEVLSFLYVGNQHDAANLPLLKERAIERVLNVTCQLVMNQHQSGISYKTLPAADTGHQNIRQYFDEAVEFIEEGRRRGERVLVHCMAGVSRSPTIVIAYVMKHLCRSLADAYQLVKTCRPIISPNLNFMGQLLDWERHLADIGNTNSSLAVPSPNTPPSGAAQQPTVECIL